MVYARQGPVLALYCLVALFVLTMQPALASASVGSIKGTVSATTSDASAHPTLLAGARLTLVNRALPEQAVKTVTDEAGNFSFNDLPAGTYLLSAEADGFPPVMREINLPSGANVNVEILLTASLSESVTVHDEEGLLSTSETTTTNVVRAKTLSDMPLRAENFQSALLLTPGVVRDAQGSDHLKGARAGQSAYTVNGVDVTDPAGGNLAFDIPLEAAAAVQVEENPYSAEFGHLTGGATNLETKGGTNKFKLSATRFFPVYHHIFGGAVDSFRPRLTMSGPLLRDRLFWLQSFEYRFSRIYVPSLPTGRDSSTSENFNSFTQIDLNANKNNRLKFVAAFFPQKVRDIGLNTFNPQTATPNLKQRGDLFSISEQAVFGDASFLNSSLSYRTFDIDVFAQDSQPLTVTPDGNTGNYFADSHRQSHRLQWQETYYAQPLTFGGQHSFKLGAELDQTRLSGLFHDRSILIRRRDNTLAQQIDFAGDGTVARTIGELTAFVQDRWVVNQRLTIDGGLRFDRDGIARRSNFAPRLSLLYVPFKGGRTALRGGVGLFYDRVMFSVGDFQPDTEDQPDDSSTLARTTRFTQLPRRVVTTFASDGSTILDGPRRFRNIVDGSLRDPRSLRWSLQLDHRFTQNLTARVGYLARSTTNDLLIDPRLTRFNTGRLLLHSLGRAQYHELQLLATYTSRRIGNWTATYTWSRARGDLNTADNFLSDLPALVVRQNEYGPLPWDAPHRFLGYGQLRVRYGLTISPAVEIRSGFPFSLVDENLDFVGARNEAGHFPLFVSIDAQVTKDFTIPKFIPKFDGRKARIGAAVFNMTDHFNPRDVQNNLGSREVGQFFNSLGTSVRGKFEIDF
jgi:Carboxypeptidase regulatory-like domain